MKFITRNGGFVPIGVIASFRKMKKLTKDVSVIVAALRESSLLVVSSSGKNVKRVHPFPTIEVRDPQLCTVLVENLPENHSVENLRRIFGEVGKVVHISIRDPHSVKDSKKCNYAEKLLNNKLHAIVEYDTTEAAEKAVEALNNEHDWRNGLRVKLLKNLNKPGQKKKVWREADPEKNPLVQASDQAAHDDNHQFSDHQDDSHDEEVGEHLRNQRNGEHLPKEKNGHRDRNHGHGRRRVTNGHVRGPLNPNHGFEPSKPPPGPKMPDGTKGFTMGRGRPLVVNVS
ncbi:hypothetical protein Leryth_018482 [Lithospermum erythrorhizon]|nr:hypothetical protein Leryth_018482 [Lithospermum erythrorhizon]